MDCKAMMMSNRKRFLDYQCSLPWRINKLDVPRLWSFKLLKIRCHKDLEHANRQNRVWSKNKKKLEKKIRNARTSVLASISTELDSLNG